MGKNGLYIYAKPGTVVIVTSLAMFGAYKWGQTKGRIEGYFGATSDISNYIKNQVEEVRQS